MSMKLEDLQRRHSELLHRRDEILRELRERQNSTEFEAKWNEWKNDMVRFYSQAISDRPELKTKKEKIIFLKEAFTPVEGFAIIRAVGCCPQYARAIFQKGANANTKNDERVRIQRKRRKAKGLVVSQKKRNTQTRQLRMCCLQIH